MTYEAWVPAWIKDRLAEHHSIASSEIVGRLLHIQRDPRLGLPPVTVVGVTVDWLTPAHVQQITTENPGVSAIVNVRKEHHYTGEAKSMATRLGVGLLTFREFMSAVSAPTMIAFEMKNMVFVKSSLRRHDAVKSIEMVCEQLLLISRRSNPAIRVLPVEEYTLGTAQLMDHLTRHASAQVLVNCHPYGQYTSDAKQAAVHQGIGLFSMKEFYGAVNFDGPRLVNYSPPRRS